MANEVTINIKTNTDQAKAGLTNFRKSFTELNSAIQFARTGAELLGTAFDETVGKTLKYAATVRQMARITGEGAEETSRLIQLTDDLGVEQGDLEAAMSAAARKGIAFNTEHIAKLADEYVALSDPVAKNTLLVDNFGRSGLKMAAAMEKGGDAIRKMAGEVEKNLILTDKQIQQTRALEIAQDNLNDKLEGYKVQLGAAVVPALVDYANATDKAQTAQEKLKASQPGYIAQLMSIEQTSRLAREAAIGVTEQGFIQAAMLTGTLTPATQGQANAQRTANDYMQEYSRQLIFAQASTSLDADAQLALAYSLGLVNEKTKYAADRTAELTQELINGEITKEMYIRQVTSMANALDRIQSKKVNIDIYIQQHGGEQYTGPGSEEDLNPLHQRARGGPVAGGQPYLVGERGPEMFVPGSSGNIIPNNQITNNHMGGNTYNFYITGSSAADIGRKLRAQMGGAYQGM